MPRNPELIVIYTAPKPLADVILSFLQGHGISASLSTDDAGGVRPDIGFSRGARVLVRAEDAAHARRLIDEAEKAT